MPAEWHKAAIEQMSATIIENAELLTELDSAIGDGDHGNNMKRGFQAVADKAEELANMETGPALQKLGMTLVTTVGGASGPLFGSFFMQAGKELGEHSLNRETLHQTFTAGVEAIKARGKSTAGEKTMLDVLVPAQEALAKGCEPAEITVAVNEGLERTREMKASKGRAAYLGERSVGHLDPGAYSSTLLITALCKLAEEYA